MNKKLLSIFVSLSLIVSATVPAFAEVGEMIPMEINDKEIIRSENIIEEQSEMIPADFVQETGEILPLDFEVPDEPKTDRFIIKYKDSNAKMNNNKLTAAIKKMKSVADVKDIQFADKSNIVDAADDNMVKSISLDEKVDVEEFINEVMSKNAYAIEYIQPDYMIDLSAYTGDETAPEKLFDIESESDGATTSDKRTEAVQMDVAEDESIIRGIEDIAVLNDVWYQENEASRIVALIDTGVDITNPALNGHILTNEADDNVDADNNGYTGDINGWDFYNDGPNVYNPDLGLEQAHGTLIAGVIAETAPNSKILPLKVFENGTAYTSDIIEAIEYADSMGADIVNCSWGCTDENRALKEAMERADMMFVCAVGNNRLDLAETPIYPACYDLENIVSVTSVNADGGLSYFSNYNNVDIAALGRNVEGIFPGGETGVLSGTSMSAGYVSGALASIYTDAEESVARLYNTSDKLLNLQNVVTEGRRLNLSNLQNNISSNEVIDVNPAEDFNTEGYNRTPAQSWELFTALDNVSVKAGREFIAVLKADGSVWTWGKNNYGQLGNGTFTNTTVPQMVPSISNVAEIAAGEYHIVVRTNAGTVFSWGRNYGGCLGNGTTTNSNVPVAMTNGINAISVAAGSNSSYMINSDYELYACGDNSSGQVGDGTIISKSTLTRVSISDDVVYVCGFAGASYAITETGKLYSWGHNGYGRLGDGTTTDRPQPMAIINSGVAEVSMGFFTAIALKEDGTVYEWGYGTNLTPTLISGISGCSKVVGSRQAQFIMQGNTIKARGMNTNGALGVGDTSWHNSWAEITGTFVDFDITEFWGAAIGTNGCIYTWGIIDADTGEYVTAPLKLHGDVNDFAPDEIDDAITISTGEILGNISLYTDVDYYKFTPTVTGYYSVYSLSGEAYPPTEDPDMDLICEIYTKNADNTYSLQYSNDDAGVVSVNYGDFYLLKRFVANTDYYICVHSYGEDTQGQYLLYINRETQATPSKTTYFSVVSGKPYTFAVTVTDFADIQNAEFKVSFVSSRWTLDDTCAQTFAKELSTGTYGDVEITAITSSYVKFKIHKTNPILSGTVNMLKFQSNYTGSTYMSVSVTR